MQRLLHAMKPAHPQLRRRPRSMTDPAPSSSSSSTEPEPPSSVALAEPAPPTPPGVLPLPLLVHLQSAVCGLAPLSFGLNDLLRLDLQHPHVQDAIYAKDRGTWLWLESVQAMYKSGKGRGDGNLAYLDSAMRERRKSDIVIRVNPRSSYGAAIVAFGNGLDHIDDGDRIIIPQNRALKYFLTYPTVESMRASFKPEKPDRGWPLREICSDIARLLKYVYTQAESKSSVKLPGPTEARNRPMTVEPTPIGIQFLPALAIKFIVINPISLEVWPEIDSSVPYHGRSSRSICRRIEEDGTPRIEFLGDQKRNFDWSILESSMGRGRGVFSSLSW